MRDRINADFGQPVLTEASLPPERMVKVAATHANMTSGAAVGLFPMLYGGHRRPRQAPPPDARRL
jgi:hypothetical protein